ncbi:MAG: hypothetical protein CL946_10160 [Ectothiorhodospiraceae bacterium]|nr:hypothetical protein [Ectothiorhodospiraceae bacterium]
MKAAVAVCIAVLAVPVSLTAQGWYDYWGYTKYLGTYASSPLFDADVTEHLLHARLNTRLYPSENIIVAAEFRLRGFYGNTFEQDPTYKDRIQRDYPGPDLDPVLWDEDKSYGYFQVDRLYIDWNLGDLQTTVGRQRIAQGTAFVWNVIDIYNPKDILDFDYEELPAVDALRVQYYTSPVTKGDIAIAPGKTWDSTTITLAWSFNQWEYDFFLLAGVNNGRTIAGGAWVGDIATAGFRGEILVSEPPEPDEFTAFDEPDTWVSASISFDYTFPNTLYLHAEGLYNNTGRKENAALYRNRASRSGLLSPARFSTYGEVSYDITPLLRGTVFAIYNPNDASYLVSPGLSWSIITNLDAYVTAFLTAGEPLSEYGSFGEAAFFRLKWSW